MFADEVRKQIESDRRDVEDLTPLAEIARVRWADEVAHAMAAALVRLGLLNPRSGTGPIHVLLPRAASLPASDFQIVVQPRDYIEITDPLGLEAAPAPASAAMGKVLAELFPREHLEGRVFPPPLTLDRVAIITDLRDEDKPRLLFRAIDPPAPELAGLQPVLVTEEAAS